MSQEPIQKEIPSNILDLINSEDTALILSEICVSNGIEGEEIEKVSYQVGRVLLGDLPPELLAKALEKNEGFSLETAGIIAQKTDQHIFSQIRESLSYLYKDKEKEEFISEKKPFLEKSKTIEGLPKDDVYRESIE